MRKERYDGVVHKMQIEKIIVLDKSIDASSISAGLSNDLLLATVG